MGKKKKQQEPGAQMPSISKTRYKDALRDLQVELVKLQRHFINCGDRILIIFEGRDASGKDGTIRSWYNRAGVERVMGFCTKAEHEESLARFRSSKICCSVRASSFSNTISKYYLDLSKAEQKKRLEDRKSDPLKQWKISPVDGQAVKLWSAYSAARDEMLARTHSSIAPWTLVRANEKHLARLNIIKDLLSRLHYAGKDKRRIRPDPQIVSIYDVSGPGSSQLAK